MKSASSNFCGYNPNLFIEREAIEQAYNIRMPKVYDTRVEKIMWQMFEFLSDTNKAVNPSTTFSKNQSTSSLLFSPVSGFFNNQSVNIDLSSKETTIIKNPQTTKTADKQAEEDKKKKEEQESRLAILLGVASAAIMLGVSYLAGQSSSEISNLNFIKEEIKILKNYAWEHDDQYQKEGFVIESSKREVLLRQHRLFTSIAMNTVVSRLKKYADTAYKVKMFMGVSALFTAISSFFRNKNLMGLGILSVIIGFTGLIYNYSQKTSDTRLENDKLSLMNDVKTAISIFDALPKRSVTEPLHYDKAQQPAFFANRHFVYWSNASAPSYEA